MAIKEHWKGFTELPADIEQKLEQLPALLEEHGVQLAYLFGSLCRDPEANDVDLAIWVPDTPAYRLREPIVECLGTGSHPCSAQRARPDPARVGSVQGSHLGRVYEEPQPAVDR